MCFVEGGGVIFYDELMMSCCFLIINCDLFL